ncbi:hypothetical protein G6O69_02325 [Pseudenhygromyxa sp. WMMC2535]|uniref:hypothetical protein n=1 Tax=Pseudenhygromyxa sp. WMMC2535 TaxID=2712867 RepID=UPI001556777B|nr:hypothetical protein [Pseudenhygromyxa sp. WMMC2535]NVB36650.1 hypothetical protein [Pseudenhygromyxa sp. WMMC2535]
MNKNIYRAFLVVFFVLLACQERLVNMEEEERYLFCAPVNAAHVYDQQGEVVGMVVDPETGGHNLVCRCVTLEEAQDPEVLSQVNDEAYDICQADAAGLGYPDAHDCADWYELNHWGDVMFALYPIGEPPQPCEDEFEGCSLR